MIGVFISAVACVFALSLLLFNGAQPSKPNKGSSKGVSLECQKIVRKGYLFPSLFQKGDSLQGTKFIYA